MGDAGEIMDLIAKKLEGKSNEDALEILDEIIDACNEIAGEVEDQMTADKLDDKPVPPIGGASQEDDD